MEGDSTSRRDKVASVMKEIREAKQLPEDQALHYLVLLSGRLGDWACVEPAVEGIKDLYANHLAPDSTGRWPVDDDVSVIAKERIDLSLFLGLSSPDEVSDFRNTVTERVLTKLLINVHAPSFGVKVRTHVLELFGIWISRFATTDLNHFLDILVRGLSIEGEDERDPGCLSSLFSCIRGLFASGVVSLDGEHSSELLPTISPSVVDDLFSCLSSYFPIQIVARASVDDESKHELETLKSLLSECFVCFGDRSIEFLLPQLEDVSACEDAFQCLSQIAAKDPQALTPFLVQELSSSVRPLTKALWRQVLRSGDNNEGLVRGIVQRFRDDEKILIATAGASGTIFGIVVSELLDHGELLANVSGAVLGENGFNIEGFFLGESEADLLVELMGDATLDLHALQAHVIEFVRNANILCSLWGLVSENPAAIVAMFRFHLKFLEKEIDVSEYVLGVQEPLLPALLVQLYIQQWADLATLVARIDHFDEKWICEIPGFAQVFFVHWIRANRWEFTRLSSDSKRKIISDLSEDFREDVLGIVKAVFDGFVVEERADGDSLVCCSGVSESVIEAACAEYSEDELTRLLLQVDRMESSEHAGALAGAICASGWRRGIELFPASDGEVWAAAVRRVAHGASEESLKNISEKVFSQRSLARFEYLFASGAGVLGERVLRLMGPSEDPRLIARILLGFTENSHSVLCMHMSLLERKNFLNLPLPDLPYLQFIMRTILTGADGIEWPALVGVVQAYLEHEVPVVRFASAQLLGLVPETAAEGKLRQLKAAVVASARHALDKEPKHVVRKQLAVTITNWLV